MLTKSRNPGKSGKTIQAPLDPFETASVYWNLPFESRSYESVVLKLQGKEPDPHKKPDVDPKDRDTVGRVVRQWEKDGNVRHLVLRAAADISYPLLLPELEDKLRSKYHLRDVAVVDISSLRPPGDPPGNPSWMVYDDRVHRLIGTWGGRILASLMRGGDVIAVGGGRGPYYTVGHCRLPRASSCSPSQVVSLSGSLSTQDWRPGAGEIENQDPDAIALRLQGRIQADRLPAIMNCTIADRSRKETAVRGALDNQISLALVGIGSLSGGHRFRNPSRELTEVEPILRDLNCMVDKIDPPGTGVPPFSSPVADVGNWFFVLPDSSRISRKRPLDPKDRLALEAKVAELNERLVNIDIANHFPEICKRGSVLAVAGGCYKLDAIYDVLCRCRKEPWISHLVTDSWTAERLAAEDVT